MLASDEKALVQEIEIFYTVNQAAGFILQGSFFKPSGGHPVLDVRKVTMDTGASSANYIGKSLAVKLQKALEDQGLQLDEEKLAVAHTVKIGDGGIMRSDQVIGCRFDLFTSGGDDYISANGNYVYFIVVEALGDEVILGLPDILRKYYDYFVSVLERMRKDVFDWQLYQSQPRLFTLHPEDTSDCIEPWTTPILVCPEDTHIDDPTIFGDSILFFMEHSVEEAQEKFLHDLPSRVDPTLLKARPDMIDLLSTYMDVFVPTTWDGIKVPPIELVVDEKMPKRMLQTARPIRPELWATAKQEFDRLRKYFFVESFSAIASPLVVAAKATPPYVRLCGDYRRVNQFITVPQDTIPRPEYEIMKAAKYSVFFDTDMTNSFHQLVLSDKDSELLSVQTPWGLYRPKFLPEGVGPASGILMKVVREVFQEFEEWTIVIFDNILILAHDFNDGMRKLDKVLKRCREYGIVLKLSKSFFGTSTVTFFGYEVSHGKWSMAKARLNAIANIPFPTSKKLMQSFLGSGLFCHHHVINYSRLARPLYEMTHDNFKWKEDTWTVDYRAAFQKLKDAIAAAMSLYFPDYTLPMTVRTDASDDGCGGALIQWRPTPSAPADKTTATPNALPPTPEVIAVTDQRFSEVARRWETIKQEAFGVVFTVKDFEFYLRGQFFILETDHANLQWIEQSQSPIIVRWRIYLQGFNFLLRHIKGKDNSLADYLSRMHKSDSATAVASGPMALLRFASPANVTVDALLAEVHGKRNGHYGIDETWRQAKLAFPQARISLDAVRQFVRTCPLCQKTRDTGIRGLPAMIKTLKNSDSRLVLGCDILTLTPDRHGYVAVALFVEHWNHFLQAYPLRGYTAEELACSLISHVARYGVFTHLSTDPGSQFTSEVLDQVNRWLGLRARISLVQRHESNGCERSGRELTRHIRNICLDERAADEWSSPHILGWTTFLIDSFPNSETGGIPPLELKFGSTDALSMCLPPDDRLIGFPGTPVEFLRRLNAHLTWIRAKSQQYQDRIASTRLRVNDPRGTPRYEPGDLVLWSYREHPNQPRDTKLAGDWRGPYSVMTHHDNDVACEHLSIRSTHVFHTDRVKPFIGSREDALSLALLDRNEYVVEAILSHEGTPAARPAMRFHVRWLGYDSDFDSFLPWTELRDNSVFHTYCRANSLTRLIPAEHRVDADAPSRPSRPARPRLPPALAVQRDTSGPVRLPQPRRERAPDLAATRQLPPRLARPTRAVPRTPSSLPGGEG